MSAPRILAIMGSGETAPTMAKVHRALFERLGPGPVPATILDTPYGFQENADDLSARTVRFFAESVGREVSVAAYRSRDVDAVTAATAIARIREARYVMAGPGSPSYALRQWVDGPVPAALADRVRDGGILTMASAAALTLGAVTIPVYEIYKVGADPSWLPGLDILGPATGLRAAVVPHYDNAEGGNHDTRFCYMGERRLRILEDQMPPGTFILGVDSHTALVLDLDRRTAAVSGLGGVTVRVDGRSTVFPSGSEVSIDVLVEVARELAAGTSVDIGGEPVWREPGRARLPGEPASRPAAPLRDEVAELEGAFIHALGLGESREAVGALLDLDSAVEARIRAGEDSPDLDNARSTFRALIARLGEAAAAGAADPRSTVDPFVEALLTLRARARESSDWATADLIRDRLTAAGVEVRDGTAGSSWVLAGSASPPDAGAVVRPTATAATPLPFSEAR
jgi:cyanophycinase-like exopeptidase